METNKAMQEAEPRRPQTTALAPFEPTTLNEAIELSKWISESSLVPSHFQKKPANVLIALGLGKQLGLTSFQSVQDIMVVNGRPSLYGDLPKAIAESSGLMEDFDEDAPDIALKQGFGRCIVTRRGRKPIERRFSVDDARTAKLWGKEGPWTNYPGRMLQLRARAFALRDAFPDAMKGIKIAEEYIDVESVEVTSVVPMPKPIPQTQTEKFLGEPAIIVVVDDPSKPISPTPPEIPVTPGPMIVEAAPTFITNDQRALLFREANKNKVLPMQLKAYLGSKGIDSTVKVPTDLLPEVIEWIRSPK